MQSAALEEYAIVSQHRAKVETTLRLPGGSGSVRICKGLDAIAVLRSLQVDLPLSKLYAKVEFPAVVE
jgi:hypothetical protein